jgi:hypothetical protein
MVQDPLTGLLLDASQVDRVRLASALQDVLGVDTETGLVVMKPSYTHMTTRHKVLAYLLGRKAAVLLGRAAAEAASPKVICTETGMPSGTVNPKLRELMRDRLVSRTESSEYYVAPHQVASAVRDLRDAQE